VAGVAGTQNHAATESQEEVAPSSREEVELQVVYSPAGGVAGGGGQCGMKVAVVAPAGERWCSARTSRNEAEHGGSGGRQVCVVVSETCSGGRRKRRKE